MKAIFLVAAILLGSFCLVFPVIIYFQLSEVNRRLKRIVGLLERNQAGGESTTKKSAAFVAARDAPGTRPKPPRTRRGSGVNLAAKGIIEPCREGTKRSIMVDMLSRKQGATMAELLEALSKEGKPWKEVTVKSGLSWDMNAVKGYGIRTSRRDGVDCYHLTYPDGVTAPLAHTPRKS